MPGIETGDAIFDIVSDAGKTLTAFDQKPQGACAPVIHRNLAVAIAPRCAYSVACRGIFVLVDVVILVNSDPRWKTGAISPATPQDYRMN